MRYYDSANEESRACDVEIGGDVSRRRHVAAEQERRLERSIQHGQRGQRVDAPIYSATKAAVHSLTISLRRQLKGSNVQVVELIPPVVETELHRDQAMRPPRAMTLDAFVSAAMAGLDGGRDEIAVGLAKLLRIGNRIAPGMFLNIINKAAWR